MRPTLCFASGADTPGSCHVGMLSPRERAAAAERGGRAVKSTTSWMLGGTPVVATTPVVVKAYRKPPFCRGLQEGGGLQPALSLQPEGGGLQPPGSPVEEYLRSLKAHHACLAAAITTPSPERLAAAQHGQGAVLAVPELGSRASSGRAWRLWAARYSQKEADPLSTHPLPRLLEPAASKVADSTAFDHSGGAADEAAEPGARRRVPGGGGGRVDADEARAHPGGGGAQGEAADARAPTASRPGRTTTTRSRRQPRHLAVLRCPPRHSQNVALDAADAQGARPRRVCSRRRPLRPTHSGRM